MRASLLIISAFCLLQSCREPATTEKERQPNDVAESTFELECALSAKLGINLNIVRSFESLDTNVYWPGGLSGPTIGVGVDLGHTGSRNIDRIFKDVVDSATLSTMLSAVGIQGNAAASWVKEHPISITKSAANVAFLRTCQIYWNFATSRFGPGVQGLDPNIKGALLSLLLNYGPSSKMLSVLEKPIRDHNMIALAQTVRQLQSSNTNKSIRAALARRRLLEHDVILLACSRHKPERVVMD